MSADDIRPGGWFTALCAQALRSYTRRTTWEYFQEKYEGVPADGIVEQQVTLAAKYAMIESGLRLRRLRRRDRRHHRVVG